MSSTAVVSGAMVAVVLGLAQAASAAEPPGPTRFWLEARPFTCDAHLTELARELTLACDAAGGACAVASAESAADRHLTLHCAEEVWTVESRPALGSAEPVWSVEVYGSDADRARSAAVFAVRAETGERNVQRPSSPASASPASAAPLAAPLTKPPDADRTPGPKNRSWLSLSAAPRAQTTLTQGYVQTLVGVGVYATARLWHECSVGVSGAAEIGSTDQNYYAVSAGRGESRNHLSAGGVVGCGAPFGATPFGVFLEAGGGVIPLSTPSDGFSRESFGTVRGALVYQLLETSSIRPWAALSVRRLMGSRGENGIDNTLAGIDLGVSWDP